VKDGVFRKAAIERVSSPEQLDVLMQVTSPIGWLALATVAVVLALALAWSVFGSIPDLVEARGVLMRGERLFEVQASMAGTVQRLSVRPGTVLGADEVVAVIRRDQAGLEERRADELSLARTESLLSAKERELATVRQQRATQEELIQHGLSARNTIFEFDRNLNVVQGEINALEHEIEQLKSRQVTTAEVTVSTAGRVVQVLKNAGDRVRENEPLLRMEQTVAAGGANGFCGGKVHAILYVPTQLAAKVRSGVLARVSPADVKREEYGYIVGRVEWVATYAASSDDMREKLKNDQLVTAFGAGGPVYEARVCLDSDAANDRNGFKWSSGKGPVQPIEPGAPCDASMVVDERRPYTYVIPALRRASGL
jgi:HlyD family secretion protein